jgi:hypothetical protein
MDDVCKCAVCSGLVARDVCMRKQATKTFVHLRPLNYSFLVTKVNQTENNSDDILIDLFRIGIFRHVIQFPPPQSTQLLCLFIPRNNYYVYLFLGVLSHIGKSIGCIKTPPTQGENKVRTKVLEEQRIVLKEQ